MEKTQKIWNASRICVSSLRRGHANLLCIVPILVYVLREQYIWNCFLIVYISFGNYWDFAVVVRHTTLSFAWSLIEKRLWQPDYWVRIYRLKSFWFKTNLVCAPNIHILANNGKYTSTGKPLLPPLNWILKLYISITISIWDITEES